MKRVERDGGQDRLEDCLSDGTEFTLKPLPALMEGRDPRDGGVHMNRTGRTPLDDMALDALGNRELLTRVPKEALDGNRNRRGPVQRRSSPWCGKSAS